MPSNTAYNPESVSSFEKSKLNFDGKKTSSVIPFGTTVDIDLLLAHDYLFTGAIIDVVNNHVDDEIRIRVVHPTYGVVNEFIDWYARNFNKELSYPAKLPAGFSIRINYKSVGASDVSLHANFSLHKVLI